MPMMRINQMYRIKNIYPQSGYYDRRHAFEGELICCESHGNQFRYPQFNPDLPKDLHHALVKVCSGFWRGQNILLTYFTAELKDIEICRCGAYIFPHKSGGGKCRS